MRGRGLAAANIPPYWQVWTWREPVSPYYVNSGYALAPATSANDSEQQSLSSDADSLSSPTAGDVSARTAPPRAAGCSWRPSADHSLGGFPPGEAEPPVVPSPGLGAGVCSTSRAGHPKASALCLPPVIWKPSPPDWQGLSSPRCGSVPAGWGPRGGMNPVQGCLPWGKCKL